MYIYTNNLLKKLVVSFRQNLSAHVATRWHRSTIPACHIVACQPRWPSHAALQVSLNWRSTVGTQFDGRNV